MEGTKRNSLSARKQVKRKKKKKSIVSYLKSDVYFFAPLFSDSPPLNSVSSKADDDVSVPGVKMNKRRVSEKVREYLNSDSYMYGPMLDPPKLDSTVKGFETLGVKKKSRVLEKLKEYPISDRFMYGPMTSSTKLDPSLKGKLQTTNLVTMEVDVSTSTTTMREDNIYRNLRTDISEQTLHNGRIHSPRRTLDILEGQRTRRNLETDLSQAFSSLSGKDGQARSKES